MTNANALTGRRVLVTRSRAQASSLADQLAAQGAHPILLPTIEIAPIANPAALDQTIHTLNTYDWVVFTSVNGVSAFWQRLAALGRGEDDLRTTAVAAIGPATASALVQHGITPRFVPPEYVAEAIVAGMPDVQGQRILLPRAELARETLAVELRQRGAIVDEIAAYRTLLAAPDAQALYELERGVDAITFTSSSTVRNFVEVAGHYTGAAIIACIGPITAQTARELGLPVHVVAVEYTIAGLVQALISYFQSQLQETHT